MIRELVYYDIDVERDRQDAKWGPQNHDDEGWLPILIEEIGEVGKAMTEGKRDEVYGELIQAVAVAVHWLEVIHGRKENL